MDSPKKAYNENRLEDARRLLLEEAAKKDVRRVIQLDGHKTEGDSVMHPDEDGHCLMGGAPIELLNIGGTPHLPVRVQIHEGADKKEVVALLGKIADWVDRDFYNLALIDSGLEEPMNIDDLF